MKYCRCIVKTVAIWICISFIALWVPENPDAQHLSIVCDEWPPYQVVEGNHVMGFCTGVVEGVLDRMGRSYTIRAYPWKRALKMVRKGVADALFSANFTAGRTAFAYYPDEELLQSPWVMWVRRKDRLKFTSYDDLTDRSVGVVSGYSYTPEFWEIIRKKQNYEETINDELNLRKLAHGRIDYAVAELGNGYEIARRLNLSNIIPLMEKPIKMDGLYIVFSKKSVSKDFVDEFSEALKAFKEEPAYGDLSDHYLRR